MVLAGMYTHSKCFQYNTLFSKMLQRFSRLNSKKSRKRFSGKQLQILVLEYGYSLSFVFVFYFYLLNFENYIRIQN